MVTIELEKEEVNQIIQLISFSSVQIGIADKALALLNKLKEANK